MLQIYPDNLSISEWEGFLAVLITSINHLPFGTPGMWYFTLIPPEIKGKFTNIQEPQLLLFR